MWGMYKPMLSDGLYKYYFVQVAIDIDSIINVNRTLNNKSIFICNSAYLTQH